MKKHDQTALVLAILLSCSAFLTSCGDAATTTISDTPADDVTSSAEESTTDDYGYIDPGIGKKDHGGQTFTIIYPKWSLYNRYYFAEEYDGETVNDAIFDRAKKIEDHLGIQFVYMAKDTLEEIFPAVQKAVFAGVSDYDLALTHCATSLLSYSKDKVAYNWNDLPGCDLDKAYWNQSVRENFEVDGVLPLMSSDYILPDVNSIFFNKKLITENQLDDPYDLVLSGKWTWGKLREMAKVGIKDLNGDSVMDDQDQYGFACERDWQCASVLTSCGQDFFGMDDNGLPTLVMDNEKTQNILEMFTGLLYTDASSFCWDIKKEYDPNWGGTPPIDFGSGRSMFYMTPLSLAVTFREAEVDYGILPYPKYDENQKDYITLNWAGFMCVPLTVADPELVGNVTELLAAESCRTVMPAFYDVLLGEKVARDDKAKETLDIIFENDVYDLGVNLAYYGLFCDQIKKAEPNNSSFLAKKIGSIEKDINNYIDSCKSYNE